jgi:hypothetical protein
MKLFKKIKKSWYSFWYPTNVVFEKGYPYNLVRSDSINGLKAVHMILTDFDTWERASDVEGGFLTCWVWYRKLLNQ